MTDTRIPRQAAPARLPHRAVPAALLVMTATGIVEAVTYGHLGRVFTAYVTGTVILAGLHLSGLGTTTMLPALVALAGFSLGAASGGAFTRAGSTVAAYARVLRVEAMCLAAAAVACLTLPLDGGPARFAIILQLGIAMGIQISGSKRLGVPDLTLPLITSVLHGILHDRAAGRPWQRDGYRVASIASLAAGAVLGGLLARWDPAAALALACLLVTAASAIPEPARPTRERLPVRRPVRR